jgi:polyphosphate kinase 2
MNIKKWIDFLESNNYSDEFSNYLDSLLSDILNNLSYDSRTNKIVKSNNFKNISISDIIGELSQKFGEEFLDSINFNSFIRKVYQIIDLSRRNTIKKLRWEFSDYKKSLSSRLSGEYKISDDNFDRIENEKSIIKRGLFEDEIYLLRIELLKMQEWVVKNGKKVIIVFEGRDAAGKGSTIKQMTEYLNPKHFNIVALGIPSESEKKNWFSRYENHFPQSGMITFFDRSWYNRAVVEPVMGYCSEDEYNQFMDKVLKWEEKFINNDYIIVKFWFSITKEKQLLRFKNRQDSPIKYWKFSPNDMKIVDKYDKVTEYKNIMFTETSSKKSPWVIVNSDDKRVGILNSTRYLLDFIPYDNKNSDRLNWFHEVINVIN